MSENKTPYELRFNIYEAAKSRLIDEFIFKYEEWSNQKDTVLIKPKFPRVEQIIEEANQIYLFVKEK